MSHDGTERIILRRTLQGSLEDAVQRVLTRRWGRSGIKGREVCLQYDFGYGMSRSIFAETFEAIVPVPWGEEDEETGVRILRAQEVPAALAAVRGLLRRPRGLARRMSLVLEEDWTPDQVRALLKRYRRDADSTGPERDGERVLQTAAQLWRTLERAAACGDALVECSAERP
jgi:hypothetical protein